MTDRKQHKEMLGRVLQPNEKQVLALRFGIGQQGDRTISEVSMVLGITPQRVRHIEQQALRKLRTHPRLQYLKDYLGENYEPKAKGYISGQG
jgi:RNA polymerase primary sigma factor